MPRRKIRLGDIVVIKKSPYSDVTPGAHGRVVQQIHGGYGVEITQIFSNAFGKLKMETRCLFFQLGEFQIASGHPRV